MKHCRRCKTELTEINWADSRKNNKDHICTPCKNSYMNEYYVKNRIRQLDSQWNKRRTHPEKSMLSRAKTRARSLGLPFDIEESDVIIPETCPIFGMPLVIGDDNIFDSPSLDRIDPSKGYSKGNIQVISMKANMIKNSASPEELKMVADYCLRLKELCRSEYA